MFQLSELGLGGKTASIILLSSRVILTPLLRTVITASFLVLQERVPRQQVLLTRDEGMQAEKWGLLA